MSGPEEAKRDWRTNVEGLASSREWIGAGGAMRMCGGYVQTSGVGTRYKIEKNGHLFTRWRKAPRAAAISAGFCLGASAE